MARKWLKELRTSKGLTQQRMADMLGMSRQYYHLIESGNRKATLDIELAAEIAATEDSLKAYMTANGADELHGPSFKITWKEVSSSRLDSKALKAAAPCIWEQFSTGAAIFLSKSTIFRPLG